MKGKIMKLALCSALALGSLSAAACTNRAGKINTNGVQPNNVRPDISGNATDMNRLNFNRWDNRRGNNITSLHSNTKMQMSKLAADKIVALMGVRSATVIMTDNNAYVGVVLDHPMKNFTGSAKINHMKGAPNMNQSNNMIQNNQMMDSQITNTMKNRIAAQVMSVNPHIKNVFVSANPDFVSHMKGYANLVKQGKPISGLILQFNTMVNRIFPSAVSK